MSDDSVESSVRLDVDDDVVIHDTKDPEEIYVTNPSKMKLVLKEFEDAIRAKAQVANPVVLGITTLSVLFVSDFSTTFGISAKVWESMFLLITLGCGIWFLRSVYSVYKLREKSKLEYVVEELKSYDEEQTRSG